MATTSTTQAAAGHDENQLVTFHLGNEEFGFDIMSVQEIIRQPVLSRIPMAPSYVEGIANLRGMVLPVIDTRARFGMPREADTDSTRVLVVDVDGVKTGLRVDRVRQVTRIQSGEIEPPPPVIGRGMSAQYLQGVVKLEAGKRIIMSLNPAAICTVDGGAAREQESAPLQGTSADGVPAALADGGGRGSDADQSVAQLVSFRLGDEEFAFPMDRVREILRVQRPSEVPNTPDYCLGILTVRGNILPVVDLRVLLGMQSLERDILDSAAVVRERFDAWVRALLSHAQQRGTSHPGVEPGESLRTWIAAFTTSSQVLMETLSQLRVANDKVLRAGQALRETPEAERSAFVEREITPQAERVSQLANDLERRVGENIREDQRLVVVQTEGTLLALLVDKVREVLHVPTRLCDPPPRVGERQHREMRGVARLNDGKRLVMLLDADNLIDRGTLQTLEKTRGTGSRDQPGEQAMPEQRNEAATHARDERQFVTFRLEDGEYGIPINQIQEIDRLSTMTRIPNSADYVEGVTNLRGEVIPVINARKRFGLPLEKPDERTRVIITDIGGKKTGLLVDSVREVLNLVSRDIAPPPASISAGVDHRYISGIGKVDNGKRMVVLLDVGQVVGEPLAA